MGIKLTKKVKNPDNNLIYIHGFSASKEDHPQLKENVAKAGYNFYSFDLPAHGSRKYKDDINLVTFDYLVNYCVCKIKELKLNKFILFGHSMGGGIVSVIAGDKYFRKQLKGVILEAPHSMSPVSRSTASWKQAINIVKRNLKMNGLPPKISIYLQELKREKSNYSPLLFDILRFSTLNRIQKGIKGIEVPTLLFLGTKDVYIPYKDTRENYSKYVDDLEIHVITGAPHCIAVAFPKEFYKYFNTYLKEHKE